MLTDFALDWLKQEWELHPFRSVIDMVLVAFFVYMLLQKRYRIPEKPDKLTEEEIDELIDDWEPEPLVPTEEQDKKGKKLFTKRYRQPRVVKSTPRSEMEIEGIAAPVLNFATYNFLGLAGDRKTIDACKDTIVKYGVGSCGPRGFYGSIDVHMDLEKRIAEEWGAEDCIMYSFGFCTISSVIPAFAKRGDLLVVDESVNFAIQEGVDLSRSKVIFFKHNDMGDLERVLREVEQQDVRSGKTGSKQKQRRFIIVQGVYENTGTIAPLNKIVELKERYKYRLIMDDSFGIGVLGETGKGAVEHCGVSVRQIDLYCANLENSFGTVGGFCLGATQFISFQRLSGLGYCFSASSPPYLCRAGLEALDRLKQQPQLVSVLRNNIRFMNEQLRSALQQYASGLVEFKASQLSPVMNIHLAPGLAQELSREQQEDLLEAIVDHGIRAHGVAVTVPHYSERELNKPPACLRLSVSSEHTEQQMRLGAAKIAQACAEVINQFLQQQQQQALSSPTLSPVSSA